MFYHFHPTRLIVYTLNLAVHTKPNTIQIFWQRSYYF